MENKQSAPVQIRYRETVSANFTPIADQYLPHDSRPVHFQNVYVPNTAARCGIIRITAAEHDPLTRRDDLSPHDFYPPELFISALTDTVTITGNAEQITTETEMKLQPNERTVFRMVIGFCYPDQQITDIVQTLAKGETVTEPVSVFASQWSALLPDFTSEQDSDIRRELRWHAYTLEAMATYSDYYGETKIPQGTIYDYAWGVHASARDNFQHALPCCYFRPALAKSTLRYLLKRTTPFGEIRLI